MAAIKAYTDISQSKKLAEVLPIESADMYYDDIIDSVTGELFIPADGSTINVGKGTGGSIAAWSLAALLGIIQKNTPYKMEHFGDKKVQLTCVLGDKPWELVISDFNNEVDACYELILKLNELNLL